MVAHHGPLPPRFYRAAEYFIPQGLALSLKVDDFAGGTAKFLHEKPAVSLI